MFTTLIYLILALAVVGLIVYLIETQIPGAAAFKVVIRVVVAIMLILWIVYYFGPDIDRALVR